MNIPHGLRKLFNEEQLRSLYIKGQQLP